MSRSCLQKCQDSFLAVTPLHMVRFSLGKDHNVQIPKAGMPAVVTLQIFLLQLQCAPRCNKFYADG